MSVLKFSRRICNFVNTHKFFALCVFAIAIEAIINRLMWVKDAQWLCEAIILSGLLLGFLYVPVVKNYIYSLSRPFRNFLFVFLFLLLLGQFLNSSRVTFPFVQWGMYSQDASDADNCIYEVVYIDPAKIVRAVEQRPTLKEIYGAPMWLVFHDMFTKSVKQPKSDNLITWRANLVHWYKGHDLYDDEYDNLWKEFFSGYAALRKEKYGEEMTAIKVYEKCFELSGHTYAVSNKPFWSYEL